ncbi:efflux RND transporter permease subunit [Chitinivibrio alkaliphilus]|uniref:Acriflavin resistance protein n=1 Tax=Chitinivibrio alkaliphilus ACht1 TaxID=1313304 RepID=U7DBH6_9BACT|nr:efflux RND transporter permease subunit [Chitinivibrio alkaliphilus]ERP38913.1 acriflavin resistance protein [Chitinivibrio alkaliphilus ACht1]
MDIIKASIQRPLMMSMVILALSMFGYVAWSDLAIDRMPEMDLPYVTVRAVYPGATPQEVEDNILRPMEDQLSTIGGIRHITSYGMENAGFIVLQFEDEINEDDAANEVKDNLDLIMNDFPDDMESPIVTKFDPNDVPIVTLAVTGDVDMETLRRYVDQNIGDRFGRINGVANVEVTGGLEREILVDLDKEKMAAHNLSIFQVMPLLEMQNFSLPAGRIIGERKEYSVRTDGRFQNLREIEDIRIPIHKSLGDHEASYHIRLRDIATVSDSTALVRDGVRFQGQDAVQVAINKSSDGNTVEIADGILALVEEIRHELPSGMDMVVVEDKSDFIRDTIAGTYENILMGIVLTGAILFLFLFDWRLTLIVGITMPVSLIMAMIGVGAMGFTLNTVVMMALTISVGVLVTNSIVVIENIVRHRNTGQDVRLASEEGAREIFTSVLASTLTNLAVFIPIANTTGIVGNVFQSLGLTIVFATLASLFLSFTLVPMLSSRMLKPKDKTNHDELHMVDKVLLYVDRFYGNFLNTLLEHSWSKIGVVLGTILFFFFTMTRIAPQLGNEFMESVDQGYISINIELPPGTPYAVTESVVADIEQRSQDVPHLREISSSIGGGGTETGVQYAEVRLRLTPETERDKSAFDIVNMIRPQYADFPDAQITIAVTDDMGGGGGGDIVLELYGDNMDELLAYYEEVTHRMEHEIGGLTDFGSSWKGEQPEIFIRPKRDMLEHYGLQRDLSASMAVQNTAALLRFNITGNDDAVFTEDNEEYPIRIQLQERYRKNIHDIQTMDVLTPRGYVQLQELFHIETTQAVSNITRKNRQRMIQVTCNIIEGDLGGKVGEIENMLETIEGFENLSYAFGGYQELNEETNEQLLFAGTLAIILTLMVLIGILESVKMGVVIFLTIPLGFIGVVWALFLTGNNISMISSLSMIMLIGIVVNNAILLIDYARIQRVKRGITARRAIVEAAEMKLKPILMANLAIIISMVPMALAMGAGGSFRAPFAVTAIGGIIVSTALTFFVIPILYVATASKEVVPQE